MRVFSGEPVVDGSETLEELVEYGCISGDELESVGGVEATPAQALGEKVAHRREVSFLACGGDQVVVVGGGWRGSGGAVGGEDGVVNGRCYGVSVEGAKS